jgi:hypothetical protein
MLGDKERALGLLKKSSNERNVFSLLIARDPLFDSLSGDPRFANLMAALNIPKYA